MPDPSPTPPKLGRGPSRDMLGGPVLGVALFLVIAVLLGWGLVSILNIQLDGTTREGGSGAIDDRFDTDAVYILQRDLLLGINAGGDQVFLYPDYDGLPTGTPNRRYTPRVADYLADPGKAEFSDVLGVVEAGTRVRFLRLIEDAGNLQTRFLVDTLVLDGTHEGIHARGMFLESIAADSEGGPIVSPREDLFLKQPNAESADDNASAARVEPIQSHGPETTDDAPETEPDTPAE